MSPSIIDTINNNQWFKLPFVIKIFVLSIFEWPFFTDFTVFKHVL